MPTAIEQLIRIASVSLGPSSKFEGAKGSMQSYLELLNLRNGFYAFESALLVRPGFVQTEDIIDSRAWNKISLWKAAYESLQPKAFFFAEDVFGNQFGIESETIVRFESETGEVEPFASTIEEWAAKILNDFNYHTGYPIAHEWQIQHGFLGNGNRLILKQPLVLGGKIELENIICWNDLKAMRARGALAVQIKNVPDGGHVEFVYTD